jgi:hypothetical protein
VGANGKIHTNLIELDSEVLGSQLVEEGLGRLAVWAVGLGEHSCKKERERESTSAVCKRKNGWGQRYIPTAFSSMIVRALVFAAAIVIELLTGVVVVKNLRMNEMMGNFLVLCVGNGF